MAKQEFGPGSGGSRRRAGGAGLDPTVGRDVVEALYKYGLLGIAAVALGLTAYAASQTPANALRALVCFVVPALWGAYGMITLDVTTPERAKLAEQVAVGTVVATALAVGAVFLADIAVAFATLGLGATTAVLLVMWSPADALGRRPAPPASVLVWVRILLILATLLAVVLVVSL